MKDKSTKYCGCLFFASNALARGMTRLAEEAFKPTGLPPSQAMLLIAIIDQPGANPTELAETMLLSPSTVTRFLEKLEERGLSTREVQGKFTQVYPTEQGAAIGMQLRSAWTDLYHKYNAAIGTDEAAQLASLAYKAAKTIEAG